MINLHGLELSQFKHAHFTNHQCQNFDLLFLIVRLFNLLEVVLNGSYEAWSLFFEYSLVRPMPRIGSPVIFHTLDTDDYPAV